LFAHPRPVPCPGRRRKGPVMPPACASR
jgi:hypothetical protein